MVTANLLGEKPAVKEIATVLFHSLASFRCFRRRIFVIALELTVRAEADDAHRAQPLGKSGKNAIRKHC